MSPGIWQIIIVAVVAVLLLGGGRFSNMMGDVAKGIKQFKKGMADEEAASSSSAAPSRLEGQRAPDPQVDRDNERAHSDR